MRLLLLVNIRAYVAVTLSYRDYRAAQGSASRQRLFIRWGEAAAMRCEGFEARFSRQHPPVGPASRSIPARPEHRLSDRTAGRYNGALGCDRGAAAGSVRMDGTWARLAPQEEQ
jgi:hypothetical protein